MEKIIINEDISLEEIIEEGTVRIKWYGIVDSNDSNSALMDFFQQYHTKCTNTGIIAINSDFSKLEFINSTGIKNILKWLRMAVKNQSYKITIIYNENVHWQNTSFPTIKMMIKDLELIKINE